MLQKIICLYKSLLNKDSGNGIVLAGNLNESDENNCP